MTDKGFNIFPGRNSHGVSKREMSKKKLNSPLVIIYPGAFSNKNDIVFPFARGGLRRNDDRGSSYYVKWSQTGVRRGWGDLSCWGDSV
jgi:hypothetical protein